jgi:hypothetical protein
MKHGSHSDNDGHAVRDSWCTPRWLADAVGEFDLDPCSNGRSHIQADVRFDFDAHGQDGIELSRKIIPSSRVFINPPYSKGQVIRWIEAYAHTRFCFLLRFDTSTAWFHELYRLSALVCIPRRRINFEPPPGVVASSNVFPHALFYANASDATDAVLCKSAAAWRTR